ncbi:MAG: efflux RND transporter periplasmic adaptor subunit [Methylocella sp.]
MSQIFVRCFAAFIVVSLVVPGAFGADDTPSVQVETVALRQQKLSDTVTAYGTVATSEESMADISFPHAGQITSLDVRAGQKVHTGEPLVTITADPATLQSYERALAALEFAKHDLARQQTLLAQRLATNAQVAAAQKVVADATVALEAERQLGNDQHTKLASAPFNGYVAQLMAAPGARLQANTAIMKLARTDQGLRIAAGLKVEDAGRIEPGMAAQITPILSSGSQPLQGTVRQISGTINATSKLIDAWIDVTQTAKLVPGTSVSVAIILSRHDGWVVPRNAVLRDDKGSYIFQVAKGRAKRVDVNTGIETDQLTEVSAAFDTSLKVVASGNYELRDGMAVREVSSATYP